MAASDSGGTRPVSLPASRPGDRAATVPVSQGPRVAGLPEAQRRWTRLRARREAIAATAGPGPAIGLELLVVRSFANSRLIGSAEADAVGVRQIVGPTSLPVHLVRAGPPEIGGELCEAIGSLVARYRNFGFRECSAWPYRAAPGATPAQPVFLIVYDDDYEDSDEYRPDPLDRPYRAPFSASFGLIADEFLCGEFLFFDFTVRSGREYRLLTVPASASDRRRRRRPAARSRR